MLKLNRRSLMAHAGVALISQHAGSLAAAPFEWQKAAPVDAGFALDLEARLDKLIAGERAWGLHGVVVARGRRIVLAGNYSAPEQWLPPIRVVREIVLPSLL